MSIVALIEDDKETSCAYAKILKESGIEVDQYFSSEAAKAGILSKSYDGYLLDLELDLFEYNGLEIIPFIQDKLNISGSRSKPIPVLIVSGHPASEYRSITQNFFTPWDHLEKPVEPLKTLVIMTKMLIRFANEEYKKNNSGTHKKNTKLKIKNGIDVYWNDKRVIGITMTLYKILQKLTEAEGGDVTFKSLHDLTNSYETNHYKQKQAVRVHIKRLKDTFKDIDENFNCIEPVFGKGYRWKD